jgi:hypothetical protein
MRYIYNTIPDESKRPRSRRGLVGLWVLHVRGENTLGRADMRGESVRGSKQSINLLVSSIDPHRRWGCRRSLREHPTKEDVEGCRMQNYHGEILLYGGQRLPDDMVHDVAHVATNSETRASTP